MARTPQDVTGAELEDPEYQALGDREYRANRAPFTTSGRLTRANTGLSTLVKYGRRIAFSSAVKSSAAYSGGSPPSVRSATYISLC